MTHAFGNAQHIGARSSQQDAFGFSNPNEADFVAHAGLLAVLADGMGGLSHGDLASRAALAAFLAAYRQKTTSEGVAAALMRSLASANSAVCELAAHHNASGDLGTTLVAAVLSAEGLEWISVGDSALFLFHSGTFTALNTPHTYAQDLDARVDAGQMTAEAAMADPQREALTSFLGVAPLTHVDCSVRPLSMPPSDCVVLASDGLFKTLNEAEMSAAMHGSPQERCDALVAAVVGKQAQHQDNVTVLALGPAIAKVQSLPPTVRMPAAAPRGRSFRMVLAMAVFLTAALVAGTWFNGCCQLPPLPAAPLAPRVPVTPVKESK